MKNFSLAALFALSIASQPVAFAAQPVSLTCVTTDESAPLKQITFYDSFLKGRTEIEMVRASGEYEFSGVNTETFDVTAKVNASVSLKLAAGRDKVLKQTSAYTNFETFHVVRYNGVYTLSAGRTCDPYYQEEEGCDFDRDIIDIAYFNLDCK